MTSPRFFDQIRSFLALELSRTPGQPGNSAAGLAQFTAALLADLESRHLYIENFYSHLLHFTLTEDAGVWTLVRMEEEERVGTARTVSEFNSRQAARLDALRHVLAYVPEWGQWRDRAGY